MYGYEWTDEYGIFRLTVNAKLQKEIRPVFKEELDFFKMYEHWDYPDTDAPLLWAEGVRRYVLNGECVAEAKGGGFYTRPTVVCNTDKRLQLQPVDINRLYEVNKNLMKSLEQKAISFIREQHDKYKLERYSFVCAFSGGKDSIVLLDLCAKALTQALLPTETEFNEQWKQMSVPYEKLNKLDKLAHKGVVDEPDYYTCIEEQIAFFNRVSDKANELLKNYQRVIITGDHGASRLAARFFHTRKGLPVFKDATPLSHGRYCSIKTKPVGVYEDLKETTDSSGQHYLVFTSYNHFSLSGFAAGKDDDNVIYGEVHGGASPEEMIVPVVVFDSKVSLPLNVKWSYDKSEAKLKRKVAKAAIEFSKEIKTLEVKAGTVEAEVCDTGDGKTWTLSFEKITPGAYNLIIVADGKIVNIDKPLTVIPALGGGGDF